MDLMINSNLLSLKPVAAETCRYKAGCNS